MRESLGDGKPRAYLKSEVPYSLMSLGYQKIWNDIRTFLEEEGLNKE